MSLRIIEVVVHTSQIEFLTGQNVLDEIKQFDTHFLFSAREKNVRNEAFSKGAFQQPLQADLKPCGDDCWTVSLQHDMFRFIMGPAMIWESTGENALLVFEETVIRYDVPEKILTSQRTQFDPVSRWNNEADWVKNALQRTMDTAT